MGQTLRQLGDLLLGSIPTIVLFLLTYFAYRFLLHNPLQRVLEDRRQRTTGAIEKARADVAAAEAKTAEYEQRLREARASVFKAQEARRQNALEARSIAVQNARERASSTVSEARTRLQEDVQIARRSLQSEAERLADTVIQAILEPVAIARSQSPAGGGK